MLRTELSGLSESVRQPCSENWPLGSHGHSQGYRVRGRSRRELHFQMASQARPVVGQRASLSFQT